MSEELAKQIEIAKQKIEDKKTENNQKVELAKLKKEYNNLMYPEKYPFRHKLKQIFKRAQQDISKAQKKAEEYNKKNPWEL